MSEAKIERLRRRIAWHKDKYKRASDLIRELQDLLWKLGDKVHGFPREDTSEPRDPGALVLR